METLQTWQVVLSIIGGFVALFGVGWGAIMSWNKWSYREGGWKARIEARVMAHDEADKTLASKLDGFLEEFRSFARDTQSHRTKLTDIIHGMDNRLVRLEEKSDGMNKRMERVEKKVLNGHD